MKTPKHIARYVYPLALLGVVIYLLIQEPQAEWSRSADDGTVSLPVQAAVAPR